MIQFDGHTATVCSLAFSPDSMTLASGAKDGGVKLWDATGEIVLDLVCEQHWSRNAIAWAAAGDGLVVADGPELARLRLSDRRWIRLPFATTSGQVTAVATLTETIVAVGSGTRHSVGNGSFALFNLTRDASSPIPPSIAGAHGVRALAAHSPTKRLHWITGLPNTTACVWRSWCITSPNATDVKLGKPASAITVSPDGGTVAIASDWIARVFTADGKPKIDLTGHKGHVGGVGFIHGGRTAVSASWDETVRFWDVATGQETARFPLKVGKLTALAVSPDGTRVAVGGTDGPIVVIDAE
jgi:WD40 repeat protein